MQIVHEWRETNHGYLELRTLIPANVFELSITPEQLAAASREDFERHTQAAALASVYPAKQVQMEPALEGILRLMMPKIKGDLPTAQLLVRMLNDVRNLAYAIPPVEVKRVEIQAPVLTGSPMDELLN